jgi:hypothetical protein
VTFFWGKLSREPPASTESWRGNILIFEQRKPAFCDSPRELFGLAE